MKRKFRFDLYRINIIDIEDLFLPTDVDRIASDDDLVSIISNASSADFDTEQETRNARYKWSLRDFSNYSTLTPGRPMVSVVLARSILEKAGLIVTDDGISSGSSSSNPPLASTMVIFFDTKRHLVAAEHTGELAQTAWKDFLEKILEKVALSSNQASTIELEPVPENHEILSLFKSFDQLTRITLTLRIPNPELTRYTKNLFDDLKHSDVREYMQDMKNPKGLSKNKEARPFASAAIAQQGYKKGDVKMEGFRNDTYEKVASGAVASRGSIKSLKDFVRGMSVNAKTKEARNMLNEIATEIDRIHPLEPQTQSEE